MKKKQLVPKAVLFLICLSIFSYPSCDSRRNEIEKQVSLLYSSIIEIPYSEMDTLVLDTEYMHKKDKYQFLVFVDSTQCTPCYASHHQDWKYILKECKKHYQPVSLSVIIESKSISDEIREIFLSSSIGESIFLDTNAVFRKHNPFFPESDLMHVLLLDKDGSVVFVGNPLRSKEIEELLYKKLNIL